MVAGVEVTGVNVVMVRRESEKEKASEGGVDVEFFGKSGKLSEEILVKLLLWWCVTEDEVVDSLVWVVTFWAGWGVCVCSLMKLVGGWDPLMDETDDEESLGGGQT